MSAYSPPPDEQTVRRTEAAQRQAQIASLARHAYPLQRRADLVREALHSLPRGLPIFNRAGAFLGAVEESRLLPPNAATFAVIKAKKAKGQAAPVAAYDGAGDLIGVVDPADLVTLGKGESYSYGATGTLAGIIDASGRLRPIATQPATPPSVGDAAVAALSPNLATGIGVQPAATPVAKAWTTDELIRAHAQLAMRVRKSARQPVLDPASATRLLCTLGKQWRMRRVAKRLAVPSMSPIEAGLRARLGLPSAERARFDAELATCSTPTRAALGRSPVLKMAGLDGAGVRRALGFAAAPVRKQQLGELRVIATGRGTVRG